MKVLGVGLGRTGTKSLHRAFQILGLKSLHFDQVRLRDILDGSNVAPDFRRYDDVDAVTDVPTAFFYRELLEAYPDCKAVLTTRPVEGWWRSSLKHSAKIGKVDAAHWGRQVKALFSAQAAARLQADEFKVLMRNYVYGAAMPREFLYKKRFVEYNERVRAEIPPHRLLVMDVTRGDGWDLLCPFLGLPIPSEPFPHENRTAPLAQAARPHAAAAAHI